MNSPQAALAPSLFDGRPVTELLVPVVADRRYERGVGLALEWAERWHVPVMLVHVGPVPADGPSGASEMAMELRHAHPELEIEGLTFDHVDVAAGLRSVASAGSLIVLTSDRASQWVGPDSVAERLTQRSTDPLLLIGPHCQSLRLDGPIVVALDGTPLAEAGIAPALAAAACSDVGVHVVSVIPTATVEHIEHLKARGERVSESAYLRSVVERLSETKGTLHWEIIHGEDPVDELALFAQRRDAAMIVATSHAGTGLGRHLFGSTTMGLVERADTPVLVIKPPSDGLRRL